MRDPLARLFNARSVAAIGGGWAANVVQSLETSGFDGDIWAVHPRKTDIGTARVFADLDALPGPPDAAFVGVNRDLTPKILRQLREMGAGGAICFASGFAETGADDLQAELREAAGDMPVLGPNCYGILNYFDKVALWPDQHGGVPVERGVGLISQSSNIAINLTMNTRGLPIGKVACVGNAACIGVAELAQHMIADPRISAIGFYLEGFGDAAAFAEMAEAAQRAGKPLVAIKAGRTEAAKAAAASHTAAMAGSGIVSSAFLARCGVAEVRDLATLIEALKIFHVTGGLAGNRLATMSCSGGEAGLIADRADGLNLTFPAPEPHQITAMGNILGPLVALANPLDYHTFIWGDRDKMAGVFSAMADGPYDLCALVMDLPHTGRCDLSAWHPTLDALRRVAATSDVPMALMTTMSDCFPEALASELIADGIIPLSGLGEGLSAIEAAIKPTETHGWRPIPVKVAGEGRMLNEAVGKQRLAALGVSVPNVYSPAANGSGPFVVKGLGLAHKSEAGAVRLNVAGDDLDDAIATVPGPDGHLIEEMVTGGSVELLVTVRRDPVCGATLTLGMGGTSTEVLADTQTLVLPVTAEDVRGALMALRHAPLLRGFRGRAAPDIDAAIDVALRLADAIQSDDTLTEIEINPLILRADGAVAVDVLMTEDDRP